ncbi:hypothetical protein ACLOJK_027448, partial [Asimina triloba]
MAGGPANRCCCDCLHAQGARVGGVRMPKKAEAWHSSENERGRVCGVHTSGNTLKKLSCGSRAKAQGAETGDLTVLDDYEPTSTAAAA